MARARPAVLALVAIVGQLVHSAEERGREHVRCSDHGEILHLPEASGGAATGGDHGALERSAEPTGASHDVCLFAAERPRLGPQISAPDVASSPSPTRAPQVGDAAAPVQVALLRLAPKNSPPG